MRFYIHLFGLLRGKVSSNEKNKICFNPHQLLITNYLNKKTAPLVRNTRKTPNYSEKF